MLTSALLLVVASSVAVSAAPSPAPVPAGISIPIGKSAEYIEKRKSGVVDLDWLKSLPPAVVHKYGPKSSAARHPKRAASEALAYEGSLWMGPITIGGEKFQIDFDTGSSDLWVPSSTCSTGGCVGHSKYTTTSTAVKKSGTFAISYGDGSSSSGPIYTDTFGIAGLTATGQAFSPVTTMAASFSSANGYPADGIAGMGFQALSQTSSPPFFQTLVAQGKVASVFSFHLGTSSSELYLGGVNTAHYTGAITYTPVTQQAYWTVALGGVKVGSTSVAVAGKSAIIDTGTTLVYGSYADVALIYKSVSGAKDMSLTYGSSYKGYWLFPCATVPSISLTFGGTSFPIPAADFNLGQVESGSSMCVGGIVGQDGTASGLGNTFLVGDVFLQGVASVFDVGNARVGFAVGK